MKPACGWKDLHATQSPPSRRRGLKPHIALYTCRAALVASFAEAWIETDNGLVIATAEAVASFAEAWIETLLPETVNL